MLTCIELSGLLLIIGVGIYAVLGGAGDASRRLTEINTGDSGAFLAITAATSLAFFAMVGFEDSVNMAEECRDPVRIFPRAMLWGMGVAATIYVVVAVLSSMLVPAEELAEAGAPRCSGCSRRALPASRWRCSARSGCSRSSTPR